MADDTPPSYQVSQLPLAIEQLRAIGQRAVNRGLKQVFARALREMLDALTQEPVEWGDPVHGGEASNVRSFGRAYSGLYIVYNVDLGKHFVVIQSVVSLPFSPYDPNA